MKNTIQEQISEEHKNLQKSQQKYVKPKGESGDRTNKFSAILGFSAPIKTYDFESTNSESVGIIGLKVNSDNMEILQPTAHSTATGSSAISLGESPQQAALINATLLRMKLIGTVLSIKRELADHLQVAHDKNAKGLERTEKAKEIAQHLASFLYSSRIGLHIIPERWLLFEDWVANIFNTVWAKVLSLTLSIVGGLAFVGGAVGWLWQGSHEMAELGWPDYGFTSLIGLSALAVGLLIEGFNFQTLEDRLETLKHEKMEKGINELLARLNQFNTSVQVGNVHIENRSSKGENGENYTLLSEQQIRQLDEQFGTHEAVKSLERTLQAHLKSVGENIQRIREENARARKITLAAGGAIFTGFFAYEVSESVMHFVHLKEHADTSSYANWLFTKNAGTLATEHGHAVTTDNTTTHASIEHEQPDSYEAFHQHELVGTAIVLGITLLAVLAAVILAIRRPADEAGGGHEEH